MNFPVWGLYIFRPPLMVAIQIFPFLSSAMSLTQLPPIEVESSSLCLKFLKFCPSNLDNPASVPNHIKPVLSLYIDLQ